MATNNAINQIGVLPAFMAIHDADQIGIAAGVTTTLPFTHVLFNTTNSFDGTSTFTAPLTGKYFFQCILPVYHATTSMTSLTVRLHTTQSDYFFMHESLVPGQAIAGFFVYLVNGSIMVPMTAGDIAQIYVSPTDETLSINGATGLGWKMPCFGGYMIAGI